MTQPSLTEGMRTLYITRHAKSSWDDPRADDFHRPLNDRGQRDAPFMAQVFSSRNEHAEHVGIFDAAIHGRIEDAVRLLTEHYTRTSSVVASQARELGHAA